MVSDTAIAVIGTLSGSIISAASTLYVTSKRQKKETDRKKAEYFLEKKVDDLVDTHKQLVACDDIFAPKSNSSEPKLLGKEIEDLHRQIMSYESSVMKCKIYISDEESKKLYRAAIAFRRVLSQIIISEYSPEELKEFEFLDETDEIDYEEYSEIIDDARNVIARRMNQPLQEL